MKGKIVGLDASQIRDGMMALATTDAQIAAALARHGLPAPRVRPRGYATLLQAIVSQQVSTAAAASIWNRLRITIGELDDPMRMLAIDADSLRRAGLSRMKVEYVKSLAGHIVDGSLPLDQLPASDEDAIQLISAVRGLGRWSAEIYLLFAEGRPDIFPAGDLALKVQAGRLFADGTRLSEKPLRQLSARWQPNRSAAALFLWHCYNATPLQDGAA